MTTHTAKKIERPNAFLKIYDIFKRNMTLLGF